MTRFTLFPGLNFEFFPAFSFGFRHLNPLIDPAWVILSYAA
jgi:hypothetical protein